MTTSLTPASANHAGPSAVPLPAAAPAPMLEAVAALFERIHSHDLRYCHWKSNEHLGASLLGASDLDLLFDRRAAVPLARLLAELGAKRFQVRPGCGYPGIEDYLLFDRGSGRLVHLHLHYQLTLGEKFLKGHRLPWEEALLATRVRDAASGVWVSDPMLELLLLLVRAALKLRTRDLLLAGARRAYVRGPMLRELRWLGARVEPARLVDVATPLVGRRAASQLPSLADGRAPTIPELRRLRAACEPALAEHRLYRPLDALRRRWLRELATIWSVARNRLRSASLRASTRTPPQGGLVVALVGADGAGKSTIARELVRWLSREAAVLPIYGGSGDGPASTIRRLVQGVGRLRRLGRRGGGDAAATERDAGDAAAGRGREVPPDASWPRLLGGALWALSLAGEQRDRARLARRARDRGMIVVRDRLPQTQHPGIGDGPRLASWHESPHRLLRALARREQSRYRAAELAAPDLVLKLHVSVPVALRRKPDTPEPRLRRKVGIVRALRFPATTCVVDLDADRPLSAVLLDAQRAIWDAI